MFDNSIVLKLCFVCLMLLLYKSYEMNKNEFCKVCYLVDVDIYFCIDVFKDVLVKDKMNFVGMKEMFIVDIIKEKFRLYYYLDSKYG